MPDDCGEVAVDVDVVEGCLDSAGVVSGGCGGGGGGGKDRESLLKSKLSCCTSLSSFFIESQLWEQKSVPISRSTMSCTYKSNAT